MVNKKTFKKAKIQKNVEIVSEIATRIEEMEVGEKIRVTPFAHSITLSNKRHPHVETVKGELMKALLWQVITKQVKFHKKGEQIVEIEKIEPYELTEALFKKDIRNNCSKLDCKVYIKQMRFKLHNVATNFLKIIM